MAAKRPADTSTIASDCAQEAARETKRVGLEAAEDGRDGVGFGSNVSNVGGLPAGAPGQRWPGPPPPPYGAPHIPLHGQFGPGAWRPHPRPPPPGLTYPSQSAEAEFSPRGMYGRPFGSRPIGEPYYSMFPPYPYGYHPMVSYWAGDGSGAAIVSDPAMPAFSVAPGSGMFPPAAPGSAEGVYYRDNYAGSGLPPGPGVLAPPYNGGFGPTSSSAPGQGQAGPQFGVPPPLPSPPSRPPATLHPQPAALPPPPRLVPASGRKARPESEDDHDGTEGGHYAAGDGEDRDSELDDGEFENDGDGGQVVPFLPGVLVRPTAVDGRTLICSVPECRAGFTGLNPLRSHLRVHGIFRPFQCQFGDCKRFFSSKAVLSTHTRTHTGHRPYTCSHPGCTAAFAQKSNLKRHFRIHSGERPFACTVDGCDAAFSQKSSLVYHVRTHTNERPFACTYQGCRSAFAMKSALTVHLRTHTGERPYKCDFYECTAAFPTKSQLNRHMRIHAS